MLTFHLGAESWLQPESRRVVDQKVAESVQSALPGGGLLAGEAARPVAVRVVRGERPWPAVQRARRHPVGVGRALEKVVRHHVAVLHARVRHVGKELRRENQRLVEVVLAENVARHADAAPLRAACRQQQSGSPLRQNQLPSGYNGSLPV